MWDGDEDRNGGDQREKRECYQTKPKYADTKLVHREVRSFLEKINKFEKIAKHES